MTYVSNITRASAPFTAKVFAPTKVIQSKALTEAFLPSLGVSVVDAQPDAAIKALLSAGTRRVQFMNAHCFNVMAKDKTYAAATRSADLLLPDGIGVSLAGKMTGHALAANLNGTDLIPALLSEAAKMGKSVYLFGGTPGTADKAARALIHAIPHLRIAGTRDGFAGAANEEAVVADMNQSGADIVLVALGVPMQELWLHRNAHRLTANLTMGVGAAFDFFAGNVSRAPKLVRKLKSEWVWRLAMEPRRLAKRYLAGNFSFLARAAVKTMKQIKPEDAARRALDITVAVNALIILFPVLVLTALAIKAESKGPILFKQARVGKNGKSFNMFKFRSMVADAEARRADVLAISEREGACFKSRVDPRITKVGRFIRRFSIDELPQILNVLRGDMAVVGPRPSLPSELSGYSKRAFGRLAVKPGMTGVWQVSGRADVSFERMIDMDLAYASQRTVVLDLIIILLTFRAVFSGRGAY